MADNPKPVQATAAGGQPTYFNPSVEENPPAFTGYSRGADAPSSQRYVASEGAAKATMLEGLGNIWTMITEGTDQTIKNEIKVQLTDSVNEVRDADIGVIPGDLKRGARKMEKITRQREAGIIPDVHYWALMDLYSRQMKNRWGGPNSSEGYSEFIDDTMRGLTGRLPADGLRDARQAAAKAGNDEDKKRFQYEKDNEGIISTLYDDRSTGKSYYDIKDGISFDQLRASVSRIKGQQFRREEDLAKIKANEEAGSAGSKLAERTATSTFNNVFALSTEKAVGGPGKTLNEINDTVTKAFADKTLSPEEDQQLRGLLGRFESEAYAMSDQILDGVDEKSGVRLGDHVSAEFLPKYKEMVKARIDAVKKAALDGDTGYLVSMLAVDRTSNANDEQKVRAQSALTRGLAASKAVFGDSAVGVFLADPANKADFWGTMSRNNLTLTFNGGMGPVKDVPTEMDKYGYADPADKSKALQDNISGLVMGIGDPKLPVTSKSNAIEALYGTKNRGMLQERVSPSTSKVPSEDTGTQRHQVLLRLSSPGLLKAIKTHAEQNNRPEDWDKASSWVLSEALSQVKTDAAEISGIVTRPNGVILSYDTTTYQLKPTEMADAAGMSKAESTALSKVNMNIRAMVNVWEAEGRKPEEINKAVAEAFLNPDVTGIDLSAPKERSLWSKISGAIDEAWEKHFMKPANEGRGDPTSSAIRGAESLGEKASSAWRWYNTLGTGEQVGPVGGSSSTRPLDRSKQMNLGMKDARESSNIVDKRDSARTKSEIFDDAKNVFMLEIDNLRQRQAKMNYHARRWGWDLPFPGVNEEGPFRSEWTPGAVPKEQDVSPSEALPPPETPWYMNEEIYWDSKMREDIRSREQNFEGTRMNAGLKDLIPANQNTNPWDDLQKAADRINKNTADANALAEKLARERGLLARQTGATPTEVPGFNLTGGTIKGKGRGTTNQ